MSNEDKPKDEVKIFTGSGTFKLPENKTKTKKKTEEVHEHCGTPDCCGKCEPHRDAEYESKLRDFFKGRAH